MKRTFLNYWTDAVALVGFVFLASTGFLLRYQLPPGAGRHNIQEAGQHAQEKTVSLLWGLTRHEWGDIHYYIALGIMTVLAFHIVLHWKWILSVTRGKPSEASGYRLALGAACLVVVLLLAVVPILAPLDEVPRSQMIGEQTTITESQQAEHSIRGDMTLAELEAKTNVPLSHILKQLGLPSTTSPQDRIGQLKREYGFQVDDVRRVVSEFESP